MTDVWDGGYNASCAKVEPEWTSKQLISVLFIVASLPDTPPGGDGSNNVPPPAG
eukprot:CAMPEP_0185757582 /NCGR_PEP_ID=MMETSP1174-20130828/16050_1 /TAXON_ID=35687 /ORGANISM="Dictyocha speculum, Strain CCMP1381" /LENGTH=53 /DNA_ID=CAMNT_0028437025 /DNA_START=86 /DNA_END=243 /DNA_ORIENTATION=+